MAKSNKNGIFVVLAAALLTGGCTVGPDYVKPTIDTPSAYKETQDATNAEWKLAEPKDNIIHGAWWEIYNDPQLSELEKQVDISNQNIAVAEAQYRQARALVQASRAGYFPVLSADASYTRARRPVISGHALSPSTGATTNDYLLSGTASWEPDIWGKVRRSVESSEASAQASEADLEAARLIARSELAQDYFQLRALDAQKKLFDETVAGYQTVLELTKRRYNNGVSSKADVMQAETQLKTAQAQAIDLGVQRAQLEHAIALLIGKPASVFSIPFSPITATPPPIPVGVPSTLLERRPDIAAAERRAAAANAQIGVAEAAYYPNITLNASGGFESSDMAKWLSWPSRLWSLGTTLAGTIFDGGLRSAQTAQARAAHEANIANYRQTVLNGFKEVEDNLAALRILEQEAMMQDAAVKAARESVRISTNQYKAGIINYLDVITVQTIALNNERTAIDILNRRMTASVLLIKALGGGWEHK